MSLWGSLEFVNQFLPNPNLSLVNVINAIVVITIVGGFTVLFRERAIRRPRPVRALTAPTPSPTAPTLEELQAQIAQVTNWADEAERERSYATIFAAITSFVIFCFGVGSSIFINSINFSWKE